MIDAKLMHGDAGVFLWHVLGFLGIEAGCGVGICSSRSLVAPLATCFFDAPFLVPPNVVKFLNRDGVSDRFFGLTHVIPAPLLVFRTARSAFIARQRCTFATFGKLVFIQKLSTPFWTNDGITRTITRIAATLALRIANS